MCKNILVLGATGAQGIPAVVKIVKKGFHVYGMSRQGSAKAAKLIEAGDRLTIAETAEAISEVTGRSVTAKSMTAEEFCADKDIQSVFRRSLGNLLRMPLARCRGLLAGCLKINRIASAIYVRTIKQADGIICRQIF